MNGLSFPVKSYIGFNNFYNYGQNMLRKFILPAKLLQPFAMVGGCRFCIASNLFPKGFTHTFLFQINISLPMYCRLVLNNWHFLGDIFNPFFNNAFHKSSSLFMCDTFDRVNNKRSSVMASQYFLLCRQCRIAVMYDCQIEGEMFNPIDIL